MSLEGATIKYRECKFYKEDKEVNGIMPKGDKTGPPKNSGGPRSGQGKGKGRATGAGVGSKKGGKKGACK